MPKGEELRSVPPQNVSHIALGLEVQDIFSPSGRGRSVSLDIPLYRTGHLVANPVDRCVAEILISTLSRLWVVFGETAGALVAWKL